MSDRVGARDAEVTITVCPNGPLLINGPAELRDVSGGTVEHNRNVIALCRCGRSAIKPLCDGSHRQSRFRDEPSAQTMTETLRSGRPGTVTGAANRSETGS